MAERTKRIRNDNDLRILKRVINTARNVLHHLVFEDSTPVALDLRPALQEGWPDAARSADSALNRLENCTPRLWSELERVGLIGSQLRMKWTLLDLDLNAGLLGRVLKRLNSILSSLAKAIFVVEVLKEFKDHVEISITDLDAAKVDFTTLRPTE